MYSIQYMIELIFYYRIKLNSYVINLMALTEKNIAKCMIGLRKAVKCNLPDIIHSLYKQVIDDAAGSSIVSNMGNTPGRWYVIMSMGTIIEINKLDDPIADFAPESINDLFERFGCEIGIDFIEYESILNAQWIATKDLPPGDFGRAYRCACKVIFDCIREGFSSRPIYSVTDIPIKYRPELKLSKVIWENNRTMNIFPTNITEDIGKLCWIYRGVDLITFKVLTIVAPDRSTFSFD